VRTRGFFLLYLLDALPQVPIVFRHCYPRQAAVRAMTSVILANLPDSVQRL
jgi:hypothetical protein